MTSGGGSWGNPAERDPLEVLQDVKEGFVSLERGREDTAWSSSRVPGKSIGGKHRNVVGRWRLTP
jgi:N-methylhydantoinase B/oxoprolinase/acetone carboxylase alpha subunit